MESNLLSRIEDLQNYASKKGISNSKFLTPSEAIEVKEFFSNKYDIEMIFDGGFADAERVVAIFVNREWGSFEREEVLEAIRIDYREKEKLTHRDLLGAVLGLGIKRDVIGDIFVCDCSYLICLKSISDFIFTNLTKVGRIAVSVKKISLDELPKATHKLKEKTDTIASSRLDAVVSSMFNISRRVASEVIGQGKVQLSYKICENVSKNVCEGDIISVRGMGKSKLLEIGDVTKKGRIRIKYGIYI
ncbi:MAG: hypothetical protein LBR30_04200 [Clostridioides sp.]|jgi:RNA-binding protein YlmH|nr:hypothetical protein [Clostridioides sp.]